ncbi:MAG: hypothetical protein ABIZ09_17115, partial [Rhodoferax sp.]
VLTGAAQHIFVPQAVAQLMRATGRFAWLPRQPTEQSSPLRVLYRHGAKCVYNHLHFSVYGKFEERKMREATAIRSLIDISS